MRKLVLLLLSIFSLSTTFAQLTENDVNGAKQLVARNAAVIGLQPADIENSMVSSTYTTREGIRMVYLQQSYLGIPVFNQLHVLAFRDDKAVSVAGGRIPKLASIANAKSATPGISADQAVLAAIQESNLTLKQPMQPSENILANGSRKLNYGTLHLSLENITAELIWLPLEDNTVRLAWLVFIAPHNADDYWLMKIDAFSGAILNKQNLTAYDNWGHPSHEQESNYVTSRAEQVFHKLNYTGEGLPVVNGATYNVVRYPAESPAHPGGAAATHTDPWTWAPGNATSLKWHDDGPIDYVITRGNNVWSTEGQTGGTNLSGTIQTPAGQPATSSTTPDPLTFNFTPDYTVSPTVPANQNFAITNLFYWNNLLHDITYVYGFDEASGNFQNDNQGRGGTGGDYVIAIAQSAAGTNNANFSTPADGSRGRMRMYLFTTPNPDRDGTLDNGVVCHEFGHGISNRLTGGGSSACLGNVEQGGEGWGDYMALMLTTNWATATISDGFNIPRAIATYAMNQNPATGAGFRNYRYCTNMTVNPLTYANMGVPPIGTQVHNIGEIWCMALWEMTWEIIQTAGINPNLFNPSAGGGNAVAFKLVVEGMRLQNCNPGFIDARNAILKADTLFFGGQYSCAIWKAFAKRGMGRGASQGSSNSGTDQTPSFVESSANTKLSGNPLSQQEGLNITFNNRITVDNCLPITNYYITDTLPTNVTYVSGGSYNAGNRTVTISPVSLSAGATQTYPVVVSVDAGSYFAPVTHFNEAVTGATIPAAWTAGASTPTWTVASGTGHSLPNSFAALYNINATNDMTLATTAQYTISPNVVSNYTTLSFWHQYNTEEGWDGGVVEISTNNGSTWSDLGSRIIKNGYNGSLGSGSGNPIAGRSAFTGTVGSFVETIINLSAYAGQQVKIRFRFASDNNTGAASGTSGWWVDDIVLYSEPAVQMRSNLFNAANVRQSYSDTVVKIISGCAAANVTTQPADANGCIGGSTTFSVVVSGTNPTFQWQENTGSGFVNLTNNATYSGVTTSTLTVSGITAGMAGYQYRVLIGGDCTTNFNSNNATLSVGSVASITQHPLDASVCPGVNVNFTAAANNPGNLQWQVNTGSGFTNLSNTPPYSGVNTTTLTITGVTTTLNSYQYRLVVGSCPSPINTNAATLTVSTPLAITGQPAAVTACTGDGATFTVTATGTVSSYQWQSSPDGVTFTNISGANSASYTLSSLTTAQSGTVYHVLITGPCGNVTSSNAVLTVNARPTFTLGAIPTSVCNSDPSIPLTATPGGGVWSGSGVSGSNFVPATAGVGTHQVTYTLTASGCSSAQSINIEVAECSGRHLLLTNPLSVLIVPNPNNGVFRLRMNSDLYTKLGVKVFDSKGSLVKSYFFSSLGYGSEIPMNLQTLQDGVYRLYFYNEENGFISRGANLVLIY